jgi:lipopolysaccharide exporter
MLQTANSPQSGGPYILGRVRSASSYLLRDTNIVICTVVATNLLRMISGMVLTRLLVPEVFGIVGLIGSISYILTMLSDLGFQAFVIRHKDGNTPYFLDVIWTVRLLRATALCVILILLSEPIAMLLGNPGIWPAITVSAVLFLIEGASSLSVITALRDRQLGRLSTLDIIGVVTQVAASVVLALVWRNYWAIIWAILISNTVRTILSYVLFPGSRRRFRLNRQYSDELWRFARFITGSSIITMLLMQSDKIVLARLLPLDMLGLYMLAGNLALAPMAFTYAYASRVLYPAYAHVWRENPDDLKRVYYAKRWKISMLYMLAAGGLIGVGPLIVAILYDPRYAGAAVYLRWLAITPLLGLATCSANEALTASGRVHVTFHANIAKLAWLAAFGPASFMLWGPIGLVACVGTLETPTLIYSWVQLHRFGLFDPRNEMILAALGGFGIGLGYGVSAILVPLI